MYLYTVYSQKFIRLYDDMKHFKQLWFSGGVYGLRFERAEFGYLQ